MSQQTNTHAADAAAPECVLLTDPAGTVRWASPAVDDVLGQSPEPGESVASLLGPAAPDPPAPGTTALTTTVQHRDTALSVVVEALADSDDAVYRCRRLDSDAFDPHRALERVTDAVVELDTDWRYTYVNDAAETLLERSADDLLGEVVWKVFPETEGTRVQRQFVRAMQTQVPLSDDWYWGAADQHLEVRCFPSETGLSVYFRDVSDRLAREAALQRERDLVEQLLSVSPMGIAVHTPDGRFVRLNERAESVLGVEPDDLLGEILDESDWDAYGPDGDPFPDEQFPFNVVRRTGEPTFGTEMSIHHPDGADVWLSVSGAPLKNDDGDIERIVVAFEDITERKEGERRLAAQHDELRRINDLNDLIRGVTRVAVGATDRETIEQAVCDTLVRSERYPAAMTARLTADDQMQVECAAGLPEDLLTWLRAEGAGCIEPALYRSATERVPTVLGDLQTDEGYHELLRSTAADCGCKRLQNVPLEHDGTVYGVLTVAAADETAFDEREQAVFVELGQLLGTAVEAIHTKKLLHASSVQEVELEIGPRNAPLVALTDRVGGSLTLTGVVPIGDGQSLLYAELDGVDPADVEGLDLDGVELLRVIEREPSVVVELRVDREVAMGALLDSGGRIHAATAADGVGRFTVDLTLDTDVRRFLDRVRALGVDVDLLAKREVDRTPSAVWNAADDTELTGRQRTVLEAAYRSGYFDWPHRRTTGTELADSLGISSSTLHQHLRVASAKVLEQYFAAA